MPNMWLCCIFLVSLLGWVSTTEGCTPDANGDILVQVPALCTYSSTITARNVVFGAGVNASLAAGTNFRVAALRLEAGSIVFVYDAVTVDISQDAELARGSLISGLGRGFARGLGPGAATASVSSSGAAHSGCGGQSGCAVPPTSTNSFYGSFVAPAAPGSGGSGSCGGAGGAALRLRVAGSLSLGGLIDVSGTSATTCSNSAPYPSSGGGSGGSVFISCGRLLPESNGSIAANGGGGAFGASAGRIAVACGQHSFRSGNLSDVKLSFAAAGGASSTSPTANPGAPGTVWLDLGASDSTGAVSQPFLIADGGGVARAWTTPSTLLWSEPELSLRGARIVARRGARLQLTRNSSDAVANATLSAMLEGDGSGAGLQIGPFISATLSGLPRSAGDAAAPLLLNRVSLVSLPDAQMRFSAESLIVGAYASLELLGNSARIEVASLLVRANGTIIPSGSAAAVLNVTGDVTIEKGGLIYGVGGGFAVNQGPGAASAIGFGGSHAGCGGQGGCSTPPASSSAAYGSFLAPTAPGSGGSGPNGCAGSGGAAVRLHAGGTFAFDGRIDVSGASAASGGVCGASSGGGGAGGSIYITCGRLSQSNGSLLASGGSGYFGGSAGRIAVVAATHSLRSSGSGSGSGSISSPSVGDIGLDIAAFGGASMTPGVASGAPGTAWLDFGVNASSGVAATPFLLVDTGGIIGPAGVQSAYLLPPQPQVAPALGSMLISLRRSARLQLIRNSTAIAAPTNYSMAATIEGDSSGASLDIPSGVSLELRGLPNSNMNGVPATAVIQKALLRLMVAGAALQVPTQLSIASGGGLIVQEGSTASFSNLEVRSGGNITVYGMASLTVSGNMTTEAGSLIDGAGRGFACLAGPGSYVTIGAGGSHAGCGGQGACNAISGAVNSAYGYFQAPVQPGSGGYGSCCGAGGAALRLQVLGNLSINGRIDMGGSNGPALCPGSASFIENGGGSGGSIYIQCGRLADASGVLSVRGGSGANGGSAGRIAVVCAAHGFRSANLSDIRLNFAAEGGMPTVTVVPRSAGAPGTVWLDLGASAAGAVDPPMLLADAGGLPGAVDRPAHLLWPQPAPELWRTRIVTRRGGRLLVARGIAGPEPSVNASFALSSLEGDGSGAGLELAPSVGATITGYSRADNASGPLLLDRVVLKAPSGSRLQIPTNLTVGSNSSLQLPWPSQLSLSSLLLRGNASIVVSGPANISVAGDATIDKGGIIYGIGTGWVCAMGPGAVAGGGAGHAGCGGQGACVTTQQAASNAAYGSFLTPLGIGSGGFGAAGCCGGGGGALQLTVGGILSIHGRIDMSGGSAKCSTSSAPDTSGGSGGSILISCSRLAAATGSLAVNGGNALSTSNSAFGGSAGRIAVVCAQHDFHSSNLTDITLAFEAFGGASASINPLPPGAPGSVWLDLGAIAGSSSSGSGSGGAFQPILLSDAGGSAAAASSQPTYLLWPQPGPDFTLSNTRIALRRGARLQVTRSLTALAAVAPALTPAMNVSLSISLSGDSRGSSFDIGAGIAATLAGMPLSGSGSSGGALPPLVVDRLSLSLLFDAVAAFPFGLEVGLNGSVAFPGGPPVTVGGSGLLVRSGGKLITAATTSVQISGDLQLQSGSVVDGFGLGAAATLGLGGGLTSGDGAAHAGCGGKGGCFNPPMQNGAAYGLFYAPTQQGSGGGGACGGAGGAAVRLAVSGSANLDGAINVSAALGRPGCPYSAGGGSGGSVFVTCGRLESFDGFVSSNGGSGVWGGSAGRIAIVCSRHSPDAGNVTSLLRHLAVTGGASSFALGTPGAPGTTWLDLGVETVSGATFAPVLFSDGGGIAGATAQPARLFWSDPVLRLNSTRLIARRSALLQLSQGPAPVVAFGMPAAAGSWSNASLAVSLEGDGSGAGLDIAASVSVSMTGPQAAASGSSSQAQPASPLVPDRALISVQEGAFLAVPTTLDLGAGSTISLLGGRTAVVDRLIVRSGGKITAAKATAVVVAGNATIDAGAAVDGLGRGPSCNAGSGAPTAGPGSVTYGGSHAGCAGQGGCTTPFSGAGAYYGSFQAPVSTGSGGGGTAATCCGAGGAAFYLQVGGSLELHGSINVGGSGGSYCSGTSPIRAGGGSGGSIYINCGRLESMFGASLSADGGGGGFGGSAGRIAIVCGSYNASGVVATTGADLARYSSAVGGVSASSAGSAGAPGTVWFDLGADFAGIPFTPALLADKGSTTTSMGAMLTWSMPLLELPQLRIALRNSARLMLARPISASNVFLNASLGLSLESDRSAALALQIGAGVAAEISALKPVAAAGSSAAGAADAPAPFVLDSMTLQVDSGASLNVSTTLSIGPSGRLVSSDGVSIAAAGLLVRSGGTIVASGFSALVIAGNATIQQGASLDGRGLGFVAASGPGAPDGSTPTGSGASHAGCGGQAGCNLPPLLSNAAYGSAFAPISAGSGGGGNCGGAGGAAIRVDISGELALFGSIDVGAKDGYTGCATGTAKQGGGAGGSIYITCGRLAQANGTLIADGGRGSYGGSAGRIAIVCKQHGFSGAAWQVTPLTLRALGGISTTSNVADGAPGTVWLDLGPSSPDFDDRIRRLTVAPATSFAAQPIWNAQTVVAWSGALQLDELRLLNSPALRLLPTSVNSSAQIGAVSVSPRVFARTLAVSPPAPVLTYRQSYTPPSPPVSYGTMLPSQLIATDGFASVAGVEQADFSLASASVVLADSGCLSADSCASFVGHLRLRGIGLHRLCNAWRGYEPLQTWTRAQFLSVLRCTAAEVVAAYNFSADPGPWLYYESSITVLPPPVDGSLSLPSSPPVVVRRAGATPTVKAPAVAQWSEVIALNATLLRALVAPPPARGSNANSSLAGRFPLGAECTSRDGQIVTLPVPHREDASTISPSEHSISAALRFVSSACEALAAPDAGGAFAWRMSIFVDARIGANMTGEGALRHVLLATVFVPVVQATVINLPPLVPRVGAMLPGSAIMLPAPGWTPAEAAAVCNASACSLSIGPFTAATPCPDGGALQAASVVLPPGIGAWWPATLSLCGGLLNIALGTVHYAPAGVASVWPPALLVPVPQRTPSVQLHMLLAAADDAVYYSGITVGSAPCDSAQIVRPWVPPAGAPSAAAAIRCSVSSAAFIASIDPLDAAWLPVNFTWGGGRLAGPTLHAVARPTLARVEPVVLNPGGVAVITGSHFCSGDPSNTCFAGAVDPPVQLYLMRAPGVADDPASPWRVACIRMMALTDGVASCEVPALSPTEAGYPRFSLVLENKVGAVASQRLDTSFPSASGYVQVVGGPAGANALPTRYVPSDASAQWLVPGEVSVEAVLVADGSVFQGLLDCALTPKTLGVLVVPEVQNRDLSSVQGRGGIVSFGRVGIQSSITQASVTLLVTCRAPESSTVTSLSPLNWTLTPHRLSVSVCDDIPVVTRSMVPLPLLRVAIRGGDDVSMSSGIASGSNTSNSSMDLSTGAGLDAGGASVLRPILRECAANRSFLLEAGFRLPPMSCNVLASTETELRPTSGSGAVNNSSTGGSGDAASTDSSGSDSAGSEAVLLGNGVDVNRETGVATFSSLRIGGGVGASFRLNIRCTIGSVSLPLPPPRTILLQGCAPGSAPSGATCAPCGDGTWSAGGAQPCTPCPLRGAQCIAGTMYLQQGYWRPSEHAGLLLNSSSPLYPCLHADRCIVNTTAHEYSCVSGAIGPLCAICDTENGFADVGGTCEPCPSSPLSGAAIGFFAILFVGVVAFLVLRRPSQSEAERRSSADESIALRILLTHVQALSALRAFRSAGLSAFAAVTAWTDVVNPGILSGAPSQCTLRPSAEAMFLATLLMPIIACGVGLIILLLAALCKRQAAVGSSAAAGGSGSPNSPRERLSLLSTLRRPSVFSKTPSAIVRGGQSSRRPGSGGRPRCCAGIYACCTEAGRRMWSVWASREHERVLMTLASVTFMSVVAASIGMLECTEPIEGVKYLRSDLRVQCRGPSYTLLALIAGGTLVGLGIGFPLLIVRRLRGITAATITSKRYEPFSFLFIGYRVPEGPGNAGGSGVANSTSGSGKALEGMVEPNVSGGSGELVPTQRPNALARRATLLLSNAATGDLIHGAGAATSATSTLSDDGGDTPRLQTLNPILAGSGTVLPGSPLAALGHGASTDGSAEPTATSATDAPSRTVRRLTHSSVVQVVLSPAQAVKQRSASRRTHTRGATKSPASNGSSADASENDNCCCTLHECRSCFCCCKRSRPSPLSTSSSSGIIAWHPAQACTGRDRGNRAFWESTVLLRKASIVLLARLVPAALPQIACFVIIMSLFFAAHSIGRPYRDERFAFSEGASIMCVLLTAGLAIVAQPSADAGLGGATTATVLMLLINALTLLLLLRDWLGICAPKHASLVRITVAAAVSCWTTRCNRKCGKGASATSRKRPLMAASPSRPVVSAATMPQPSAVSAVGVPASLSSPVLQVKQFAASAANALDVDLQSGGMSAVVASRRHRVAASLTGGLQSATQHRLSVSPHPIGLTVHRNAATASILEPVQAE